MTNETAPCPDVTGHWPGYWLLESNVPDVDTPPPVKGELAILMQEGDQIRGEVTTVADHPGLRVRYQLSGTLEPDGSAILQVGPEKDGTFQPHAFDWATVAESKAVECRFAGDFVDLCLRYRLLPTRCDVEPRTGGTVTMRFRGVHRQAVTGLTVTPEALRAHVTEFGRICSRLRRRGEEPTLGRVFDEMFGPDGNPLRSSWRTGEA